MSQQDVHKKKMRMLLWMILPKTLKHCFTEMQPVRPHTPPEFPWSTLELRAALQKLRRNKSPNEYGLVAEFLKKRHNGLSHCFACSMQCGIGDWRCPRNLAKNYVHHATKSYIRVATRRFPACCFLAAALQHICLYDPWTDRKTT